MPTNIKKCPHCHNEYERLMKGTCPFCKTPIKRQSRRTCPACQTEFTVATIKKVVEDGKKRDRRYCPGCGIEIFYPAGRLAGQTLLVADKEAATMIVNIVAEHISKRDGCEFAFEGSELSVERIHAYDLLNRSKTYLNRQEDDLGIDPYDFVREVLEEALHDNYWSTHIKTLRQLRSSIGQFAQDLFKRKKQQAEKKRLDLRRIDRTQERDYVPVSYTI